MEIRLHANATTTPKTRAYIQQSSASVSELARELNISQTTVRRWRARVTVADGSHIRNDLGQSTSATEERLIHDLRKDVGLNLDDLVEVMHRCVNPSLSRSAVYRCLRRLGLSARTPQDKPEASGRFQDAPFGFVHMDLKHLTRLKGQRAYVFVAIERTTRFVYVETINRRDARTVAGCLERFIQSFGYPVHTILTDNGSEFTDRFAVDMKGKPEDRPSGRHPFDRICQAHRIEHRLIKPFTPQTNGMVERFNRRIAEALRNRPAIGTNQGKNKFKTPTKRNEFIRNVVYNYNRTRLRCLDYKAPIEVLHNHTEHYTHAGNQNAPFNIPRSEFRL